jgi:hypothetical protein
MGCLKPLKLKELFMWCAVMGAFGVQLWGLLVCSYGNPGLRPEKPREFFIWCTDMELVVSFAIWLKLLECWKKCDSTN